MRSGSGSGSTALQPPPGNTSNFYGWSPEAAETLLLVDRDDMDEESYHEQRQQQGEEVEPVEQEEELLPELSLRLRAVTTAGGSTGTTTGAADPSCNRRELAALVEIVRAHERYYYYDEQKEKEGGNGGTGRGRDGRRESSAAQPLRLKRLFQSYRGAVRDCLAGWSSDIIAATTTTTSAAGSSSNDGDGKDGGGERMYVDDEEKEEISREEDTANTKVVDRENFALLQSTHTVMHLSEIFLPLLLLEEEGGTIGTYGYDSMAIGSPMEAPGIASAETVRFLRYNLMPSVQAQLESYVGSAQFSIEEELLEAKYPDQQRFGAASAGNGDEGDDEYDDDDNIAPYWYLVELLVLRGCLEEGTLLLGTRFIIC